jgi:uncharacterized protein (UPF0335 family)
LHGERVEHGLEAIVIARLRRWLNRRKIERLKQEADALRAKFQDAKKKHARRNHILRQLIEIRNTQLRLRA